VQDVTPRRGHGLAGNVYPCVRAAALRPADQVALVVERALATLQAAGPGLPRRAALW